VRREIVRSGKPERRNKKIGYFPFLLLTFHSLLLTPMRST